jgi:hypothetical protein
MNTNIQPVSRWPSAAQWLAEALAGGVLGLALAAAGGLAGARAFAGAADGWGDLVAAVLGMILGYTIGASIGVYAAGRRLAGRGSYWLALAGSVVGAALVLLLAEPLRLNANATLLQIVLAIAIPLVSALAFNAGLRFRK